jgi:hypothetical protein
MSEGSATIGGPEIFDCLNRTTHSDPKQVGYQYCTPEMRRWYCIAEANIFQPKRLSL